MSTQNDTYLTADGNLPDDLDWEIDGEVTEHEQTGQVRLQDLNWEFALHYGGPSIEEMLTWAGSVYHERLDGHMDIGYTFEFRVDEQDRIIAKGRIHPAECTKHSSNTMTDTTIVEADIVLTPKDPRTAAALREYIRDNL